MMVLGTAGPFGSGKEELGRIAGAQGFTNISTGELVREELKALGYQEPPRSVQLAHAIAQRQRFGAGYWAKKAIAMTPGPTIVDGLRSWGEAIEVLTAGGLLVWVEADLSLRYERIQIRRQERDRVSFSEFCSLEAAEMGEDEERAPAAPQLARLRDAASVTIYNNGSLIEFRRAINDFFQDLHRRSSGESLRKSYGQAFISSS